MLAKNEKRGAKKEKSILLGHSSEGKTKCERRRTKGFETSTKNKKRGTKIEKSLSSTFHRKIKRSPKNEIRKKQKHSFVGYPLSSEFTEGAWIFAFRVIIYLLLAT